MLRAARRALRAGGMTAFFTIGPSPHLVGSGFSCYDEFGPPCLGVEAPYEELMAAAGFVDVRVEDVTPEYLETARAFAAGTADLREELEELWGSEEVADRIVRTARAVAAIEDGRLRRLLVSGVAG